MYLSADRIVVANKAVQETFEETSVAWQAIPHWDTGDPAQTWVRKDLMYEEPVQTVAPDEVERPLVGNAVEIQPDKVRFYVTLGQACAPTPDALLAAVMSRTAKLAGKVDDNVLPALYAADKSPIDLEETGPQYLLEALIDSRARVERAGYRAPSCLITNTEGLKKLSHLVGAEPVIKYLLTAANINSVHRADEIDKELQEKPPEKPPYPLRMILLGRRQRIAHGCAAQASPGEEPVDLAVSVPPSLEVVGETSTGYIELAVRIRYALRIKDVRGLVAIRYPEPQKPSGTQRSAKPSKRA